MGWGGVGWTGGREASSEVALVTQVRTTGGGQEEKPGGQAGDSGYVLKAEPTTQVLAE